LGQAVEKLDSLRSLIAELLAGGGSGAADPRLEMLLGRLAEEFERNMDDDLGVRAATEAVWAVLREIRQSFHPLPAAAAKRLKTELTRIDQVLRFLL
jgi:hypothetical protein